VTRTPERTSSLNSRRHTGDLGWTTDLFERRHGRWQLVWSQSTATPNDLALFVQALKAKP